MKDSEFIELLNLYLDHEITAADAARLEAEVQTNPARRRVYQDYCRMQKACKVLAQDFADEPAEATDRKVVAFEQPQHLRRGVSLYVAGTLAAAACVAIVFVGRSHNGAGTTPDSRTAAAPIVATTAIPAAQTVVAQTETSAPARRGLERQSLNSLSLRNSQNDGLALASAQNDPHFAWIQDVQLAPIQTPTPTETVRFDVTPANRTENRTYTSSKKPLPSDVQAIAFRFQR